MKIEVLRKWCMERVVQKGHYREDLIKEVHT